MKVLFFMPFPYGTFDNHLMLWKKNELPSHTAYGVYGLYNNDMLGWGFCPRRLTKKITKLSIIAENIRNLFLIISNYHKYDLVYAPYISGLELYILFTSYKIFKKPIVIWQHNNVALPKNPLFAFFYARLQKGIDFRFFFDKQNMVDSGKINLYSANLACVLPWGPDLDFYNKFINIESDKIKRNKITFISTGKDSRDFKTLVSAFAKTDAYLEIFINDHALYSQYKDAAPNITLNLVFPSVSTTQHIMSQMAFSDVIVICCRERKMSTGLTSLCDALGLGKAVILTRNNYIDLDVEEIGMGVLVDENDENGWINAINRLSSNPNLVKEMGAKAKLFARSTYNLHVFDKRLKEILHLRSIK